MALNPSLNFNNNNNNNKIHQTINHQLQDFDGREATFVALLVPDDDHCGQDDDDYGDDDDSGLQSNDFQNHNTDFYVSTSFQPYLVIYAA